MAKATSRNAPRPAARTPAKPAGGGSKAAQAAAHQGRPAPAATVARPPAQPRQEVATRQQTAPVDPRLYEDVPEFQRRDMELGKENISNADLEIPRLKLMQGTSKELQQYNELRAGHFFHTAAEHIFDEPFRAVVIHTDKRYLLWRPLDDGGGILARADDGVHWSPAQGEFKVTLDKQDGGAQVTWVLAPTVEESGLANWGTMDPGNPDSPPAATLMYNYLLGFPEHPDLMPAVLTFQRSSVKVARRFNSKIKTVRGPIFGTMWEFSPVSETNASNKDYFNISVTGAGRLMDEALYLQYRDMHMQYQQTGFNIRDIEAMQDEAAAGNGEADGGQASESGPNRF